MSHAAKEVFAKGSRQPTLHRNQHRDATQLAKGPAERQNRDSSTPARSSETPQLAEAAIYLIVYQTPPKEHLEKRQWLNETWKY
jgi:hypothetical protein